MDYWHDTELAELGKATIRAHDNLSALENCRIAYLSSSGIKKNNKRIVYADVMKLGDREKVLCGYDFAITYYPAGNILPADRKEILMYHELLHVGYDPETGKCCINAHDLQDFREIVDRYGVDWITSANEADDAYEEEAES